MCILCGDHACASVCIYVWLCSIMCLRHERECAVCAFALRTPSATLQRNKLYGSGSDQLPDMSALVASDMSSA